MWGKKWHLQLNWLALIRLMKWISTSRLYQCRSKINLIHPSCNFSVSMGSFWDSIFQQLQAHVGSSHHSDKFFCIFDREKMDMRLNAFVQMSMYLWCPQWGAGTHINQWQEVRTCGKGVWKALELSDRRGNVKTNDRDSGGQISPRAETAGSVVIRELGGRWALIDWVWQLLIRYQLYLWGKALRLRHGLFNESVLWHYCRGLALNQRSAGNPETVNKSVYCVYDICAPFEQGAFTILKEKT